MYGTNLLLPVLVLLFVLMVAGGYTHTQNTHAVSLVLHPSNASSATPRPFQGQGIKIFNMGSFSGKVWQPLDNYTLHGYEIKAVIPRVDKQGHDFYTIILETKR
ncbi:MAG: hypothetical protein M3P08_05440 [Thermoproteota archaeon]|nr:hypothetical protein [Thermoproteota archaeon]